MWIFQLSFYYSCHLVRHPAHALSCTNLWKISADKHILFVYSVNLILLVDFRIPDCSWHMTEKFSSDGEAAPRLWQQHHAMENKALLAFASTVTRRLQDKSPFPKPPISAVLHCRVKVLMPAVPTNPIPLGQNHQHAPKTVIHSETFPTLF